MKQTSLTLTQPLSLLRQTSMAILQNFEFEVLDCSANKNEISIVAHETGNFMNGKEAFLIIHSDMNRVTIEIEVRTIGIDWIKEASIRRIEIQIIRAFHRRYLELGKSENRILKLTA